LTIIRLESQSIFFRFLFLYDSLFAEKNTFLTNYTYHSTYPLLRIDSLKFYVLGTELTSKNITF